MLSKGRSLRCLLQGVLAILLLLHSITLLGQRGLQLDLSIGGHHSWLSNADEAENDRFQRRFTPGFALGAGASYYITPEFGVALGGELSYQGQNSYFDRPFDPYRSSRRVLYTKIPLSIVFREAIKRELFFRGAFGLYGAFPISAGHKREGERVVAPEGNPWITAYRGLALGGHGSVGVEWWWNNRRGSILELYFSHDLTNAEEKASPLIRNHRAETYNALIGLRVRFFFALSGRKGAASLGYP